MKNIKNYTSSVSADKSILDIERILIAMGARNIAKEYDGFGKVVAISFSIPQGGTNIPFRVEFMEVFMPYIYSMKSGKTVYELAKESNYKALLQ